MFWSRCQQNVFTIYGRIGHLRCVDIFSPVCMSLSLELNRPQFQRKGHINLFTRLGMIFDAGPQYFGQTKDFVPKTTGALYEN